MYLPTAYYFKARLQFVLYVGMSMLEVSGQLSDTFQLFVCKCYRKTEFSLFHDTDLWSAILTDGILNVPYNCCGN